MSKIVRSLYKFLEGCTQESNDGSVKSGNRKSSKQPPFRPVGTKLPESHTAAQEETRIGTRKKLPIVRGKSCKGSTTALEAPKRKERLIDATDSNDDDNKPLARRRCHLF
ncbi:hypothetical protein AHAS_Ahas04G0153000 [Arachis hypogaea]